MTRFWWGLTTANCQFSVNALTHLTYGWLSSSSRQTVVYVLEIAPVFQEIFWPNVIRTQDVVLQNKSSWKGSAEFFQEDLSSELFQKDIFYRTASWFFLLKLDTFHGCWGGGGGGEWIEGRGQGGFLFTCCWFETPDSSRYITHRGIDGNSQSSLIFCLI